MKLTASNLVVLSSWANGGAVSLSLLGIVYEGGFSQQSLFVALTLATFGALAGLITGVLLFSVNWLPSTDSGAEPRPFGSRDYLRMLGALCLGAILAVGEACFVVAVLLELGVIRG